VPGLVNRKVVCLPSRGNRKPELCEGVRSGQSEHGEHREDVAADGPGVVGWTFHTCLGARDIHLRHFSYRPVLPFLTQIRRRDRLTREPPARTQRWKKHRDVSGGVCDVRLCRDSVRHFRPLSWRTRPLRLSMAGRQIPASRGRSQQSCAPVRRPMAGPTCRCCMHALTHFWNSNGAN
jgi:hypothetical protein